MWPSKLDIGPSSEPNHPLLSILETHVDVLTTHIIYLILPFLISNGSLTIHKLCYFLPVRHEFINEFHFGQIIRIHNFDSFQWCPLSKNIKYLRFGGSVDGHPFVARIFKGTPVDEQQIVFTTFIGSSVREVEHGKPRSILWEIFDQILKFSLSASTFLQNYRMRYFSGTDFPSDVPEFSVIAKSSEVFGHDIICAVNI